MPVARPMAVSIPWNVVQKDVRRVTATGGSIGCDVATVPGRCLRDTRNETVVRVSAAQMRLPVANQTVAMQMTVEKLPAIDTACWAVIPGFADFVCATKIVARLIAGKTVVALRIVVTVVVRTMHAERRNAVTRGIRVWPNVWKTRSSTMSLRCPPKYLC